MKSTKWFAALLSPIFCLLAMVEAAETERVTVLQVPGGGEPIAARTDSGGTIHLVFKGADGPQYARSSDGGKTFSEALPIVDQASRKPDLEFSVWDMAVSPEGYVHVAMGTNAWKLKLPHEEWGYFYARLEPGASEFLPVRNINLKPSEGFSLAADEKGRVAACWLSDKLYANISHDNGKTFGPTVEVDATYDPCNCCTTSAAYGADGRLAILYREETNNDRDMYLVLWDPDHHLAKRTRVSTTLWKIDGCPMSYYSVTRGRDGYVAVWPTKEQIYFARLDINGVLQSPKEIKTPGKTGMRTGMLALSATDGVTLVAWKKADQMGWQLYDRQGKPVGSPGNAESRGPGIAGVVINEQKLVLFR